MASPRSFYDSPARKSPSGNQLLQELEALSQSLYPSYQTRPSATRRASSSTSSAYRIRGEEAVQDDDEAFRPSGRSAAAFVTPPSRKQMRHSIAYPPNARSDVSSSLAGDVKSRRNRLSLSPFRRRRDDQWDEEDDAEDEDSVELSRRLEECATRNNKGFWNWKPVRALTHIGMNRFSCIFSVYVDSVRGLSPSMNGIRLCVSLRKKETRDGAVRTMPARVFRGSAEFEETLHIKCHIYSSKNHGFQSRPFTISVFAVDADQLEFGKFHVDLSVLLHKNMNGDEKDGWNACFELSGKARGSQLLLGLGYDILEKNASSAYPSGSLSSRFKGSFVQRDGRLSRSLPASPRGSPTAPFSRFDSSHIMNNLDSFDLDQTPPSNPQQSQHPFLASPSPVPPAPSVRVEKEEETEVEVDVEDFVVEEKGVEIHSTPTSTAAVQSKEGSEGKIEDGNEESRDDEEKSTGGGEVVKEVIEVLKQRRLSNLENLARQLDELESAILKNSETDHQEPEDKKREPADADLDEIDRVTGEFLEMLEGQSPQRGDGKESEISPDKTLGCNMIRLSRAPEMKKKQWIIGSRDGGALVHMKQPKLAIHISEPMVIPNHSADGIFQITQKMAAMGASSLVSESTKNLPLEDLTGKTFHQITLEGVTSPLSKHLRKTLSSATDGSLSEEAIKWQDLAVVGGFSLESMAVDALLIQCDMSAKASPYTLPPSQLESSFFRDMVPLQEWVKKLGKGREDVSVVMGVQLRDPERNYEALGWPMIAVLECVRLGFLDEDFEEDECLLKVKGIHLCGVRDESKARLRERHVACQWLSANSLGLGSTVNATRGSRGRRGGEGMWSVSLHVSPDPPLLTCLRNPDVLALKP